MDCARHFEGLKECRQHFLDLLGAVVVFCILSARRLLTGPSPTPLGETPPPTLREGGLEGRACEPPAMAGSWNLQLVANLRRLLLLAAQRNASSFVRKFSPDVLFSDLYPRPAAAVAYLRASRQGRVCHTWRGRCVVGWSIQWPMNGGSTNLSQLFTRLWSGEPGPSPDRRVSSL